MFAKLIFFSIIYKLEEHDDFFPAFHALINNLLRVLGKHFLQINDNREGQGFQ